ncbi:MAG: RNA polymerase sigma factor [Gemmatimonadota bacterium]
MSDTETATRRPGIPLARNLADAPDARLDELEDLTDEELVLRHLDEDGLAFQVLVERYRGPLLGWLTRRLGSRSEAEDLVQRTFMRVYQHLHRFDPERKFSTWLYTIAGNLAKNVYRSRSRDPIVLFQALAADEDGDERPLQWADETYLPDEMAERRDLREAVERAVEALPDHYRTVFELREREGRSYEEIAEATGLKLGTVKSRLSRARRRFADTLAEDLDGAGGRGDGGEGAAPEGSGGGPRDAGVR